MTDLINFVGGGVIAVVVWEVLIRKLMCKLLKRN